jgi:hypothetical protein
MAALVLLAGDAERLADPAGSGWGRAVKATWLLPAAPSASRRLQAVHPPRRPPHCAADAALARAIAPVRRHSTGSFAVGIADRATGMAASYRGRATFDTASIVKADILAALLLSTQRRDSDFSQDARSLALEMIELSDNDAASSLWDAIGGAGGLVAADRELGLRQTVPDPEGYWGLTATTVTDQLRLLANLTSSRSPLTVASRRYELSLLRHVDPAQDWGVTAAADPGTRPAVKNGWLPIDPEGTWIVNSIGVVSHSGHQLLIAVLSAGQPSLGAGIAQVEALAKAAAAAETVISRCWPS